MPDVLLSQTLAFEDMAEMAVAVFTENFDSKAVSVTFVSDCSWQFIVKTWPPAPRMKFVGGTVERRVTATADVKAVGLIVE